MFADQVDICHAPTLSSRPVSANRQENATQFAQARADMVERQLRARGIRDERLLAAFAEVPREAFVAPELASHAYSDGPLPIGHGQTISQPYVVALMIEAAKIAPSDKVLEVGAGSGYAAAVLGRLALSVIGVERIRELAAEARDRLAGLGFDNVRLVEGDGTLGYSEEVPYDAILCAASGRDVPQSLVAQLAPGGRLVMPLGAPGAIQHLVVVTRKEDGGLDRRDLGAVRFVPLIGAEGWSEG
jgi:protein-L-isoaspartate(D-aspartate) O-methyltransferase